MLVCLDPDLKPWLSYCNYINDICIQIIIFVGWSSGPSQLGAGAKPASAGRAPDLGQERNLQLCQGQCARLTHNATIDIPNNGTGVYIVHFDLCKGIYFCIWLHYSRYFGLRGAEEIHTNTSKTRNFWIEFSCFNLYTYRIRTQVCWNCS